MNKKFKSYFLRFCTAGIIFTSLQTAVFARILTSDEVSQADTLALSAETDVFNAIGTGIALSIARCEGVEDCNPSVDQEELKQLLEALDNRIEHLTTIVNDEDIEATEYSDILTAYVDQRENYLRYLDQLGTITPEATEEMVEEEAFTEDAFSDVDEEVEDFSVFEDAGDDLEEDIDLEGDLDSEDL